MGKKEPTLGEIAAEFIQHFGVTLRETQRDVSTSVANGWQEIDPAVRLANDLAISILGSIVGRAASYSPLKITDELRRRAAIHAEFIRSISAVENSLSNGQYGSAATLIRREFEAVNVLFANRKGRAKDRKNPGNNPFSHLRNVYRQLSEIAHNTGWEAMEFLSEGSPSNLDPRFEKSFCEYLLMCHIHAVLCVATDMSGDTLFVTGVQLTASEKKFSMNVMSILFMKGFLQGNRQQA